MRYTRNVQGFTLVEMILYVSLCSVLLLVLSSFLSFLLGSRIKSQAITEVNQQGFRMMNLLTLTIRNGRSIEEPAPGATSSVLSLTSGNPLLDPTVFDVATDTMRIKEGAMPPIALSNSRIKVSGLTFQNISSSSSIEKLIKISFVVDATNPSGRDEYSFSKTFTGSATLRR